MTDGLAMIDQPDRFFIGGKWVAPSTGSRIDVINPATEERFISVAEAQAEDMARAVEAARSAFDNGPWPHLSHAERAAYLTAIANMLDKRAGDSADIMSNENGATLPVAQGTVGAAAYLYRFYADLAERFPFQEIHEPWAGGNHALLVREPVGVVGAIVPWNAPPLTIAAKIAPALLAGCTIVLKASPEAPGAAYILGEIAEMIGLPPGVLNVVTADRDVSELLVRNDAVDKITFTGSSAAGKTIASICGSRIARCTLELGGKSAAVIYDDYDLATAANELSNSIQILSGQVCAALTRIVVSHHRHDDLVEALAASFSRIRVGDPMAANVDMGPLAMERQRDRVEGYIAKGRAEGAVVASGGKRPAHLNRGFFMEPTVLAGVDNNMTIAREEIFGPVVCVIPALGEKHALEIANDTSFGLNASIFTNDAERAYKAARSLRSGTVGHNALRGDFSIAFGGFKQSGIGREGGVEGLLPFLETKTIVSNDEIPQH